MPEFPNVALKSFQFVNVILSSSCINICMRNYGIKDVSKRVNRGNRHAVIFVIAVSK